MRCCKFILLWKNRAKVVISHRNTLFRIVNNTQPTERRTLTTPQSTAKTTPRIHKNLQCLQKFPQALQKILQGERRIGRSPQGFSRYAEPQLNLAKQYSASTIDLCTSHMEKSENVAIFHHPKKYILRMEQKNPPETSSGINRTHTVSVSEIVFLYLVLSVISWIHYKASRNPI